MRARDTIRLDTLRGLDALFLNEMLTQTPATDADETGKNKFLPDNKVLALIKKSAKQRVDSIEQFEKGGRMDLAQKEKDELAILQSFLPVMMTQEEIEIVVKRNIEALKTSAGFNPKATGKITGLIMKELAGKADGNDVKTVVEKILK